jgi:hypothetical protein
MSSPHIGSSIRISVISNGYCQPCPCTTPFLSTFSLLMIAQVGTILRHGEKVQGSGFRGFLLMIAQVGTNVPTQGREG